MQNCGSKTDFDEPHGQKKIKNQTSKIKMLGKSGFYNPPT
jgi:hypothetical protein